MTFIAFMQHEFDKAETEKTFDEWTNDNFKLLQKAYDKYTEMEELLNECE